MSTDLAVQSAELAPTSTLFGTDNPGEVVRRSTAISTELARLVRSQNLVVKIGQGEHVKVEGWTLLGSMLGVFAVIEWTRPMIENDERVGWEARAVATTMGGATVGAAEAECLRSESAWSFDPPPNKWGKKPPARDDYALRSMAQTRAVSKALRLPLGFVMQLAGFDPTPADEMPGARVEVVDVPPRPVRATDGNPAVMGRPGWQAEGTPAGTPEVFENVTVEPVPETDRKAATPAQKKKLDVLVGKLRDTRGLITTRQLWATIALYRVRSTDELILELGGIGADGELHWSPLREALTKGEAHELIERLTKKEQEVAA